MTKVFYISVDANDDTYSTPSGVSLINDVYFVCSDTEENAIEHLREQIRKYYFKAKLSNKASDDPMRLGDKIIVEGYVTEAMADAPLAAIDVTAMAYLYQEDNVELWSQWNITKADVDA